MSVKALLCHQRTKHGFRNPMRFFADDDGVCGACGTNFRTRLRLMDHLSDARRTHCRDVCNGGTVTKLSNERVEELDELDRVARTAARQSGHSHVIAQLPALSSNTRVVGRLTGLVSMMRVQTRGFVSCDVCIDILGKKNHRRSCQCCPCSASTCFLSSIAPDDHGSHSLSSAPPIS